MTYSLGTQTLGTVRCGHQTPQVLTLRSLSVLGNVTLMLQVKEKSYTEFDLIGSESRTSTWKASTIPLN